MKVRLVRARVAAAGGSVSSQERRTDVEAAVSRFQFRRGLAVARGVNLQFLSGEKKKSGKRKLQEDSPKSPDPYAFDDSADAKPTVIR